jgi:hypothetical protein
MPLGLGVDDAISRLAPINGVVVRFVTTFRARRPGGHAMADRRPHR